MIHLALLHLIAAPHETLTGKIVKVTDGDTVTVLVDKTPIKIRLASIDAPESKQPFGTKSKQALADKVFGQTIRVETQGKDRYGRTIGTLFVNQRNNTRASSGPDILAQSHHLHQT